MKFFASKRNHFTISAVFFAGFAGFLIYLFFSNPAVKADDASPLEQALFTRTEFFGAEAIVPFPTAEARERLAKVLENNPNDSEILLKLSELDEKLGNFAQAENELKKFIEIKPEKIESLVWFYNRRAMFEKEAETLEKILVRSSGEKHFEIFSRLIETAEKHDLKKYLQPEFYEKTINEQPAAFSILAQYLNKLIEEGSRSQALKFILENKNRFPEKTDYFLEKEISLLNAKEAEAVYHAAFNPFWSEETSRSYYEFLSANERYRAYGNELKSKFKKNPADFDAAIRLIHFEKFDYHSIKNLVLKLENERAKQKIKWTSEELLIVSRFLLADGEGDLASRFLYTLFLREDVKGRTEMRAKVLYQLFRLFIEAEHEKLTLSKGDLEFYKDVAADRSPGIATGILSLIFAGSSPQFELERKERTAAKLFNRAAAFQIFSEYKKEFPTSPELASMYLDIINIYTAEKDLEIAGETLNEFRRRYENATDFPQVALKLAEAFQTAGKKDEERAVYRQILVFLGANRQKGKPLILPPHFEIKNEFNSENEFYYKRNYQNYLTENNQRISYLDVLQKLIAALDSEKKSAEIFSLYAAEIEKYPEEEALYEQFLGWLDQTNLTEEQLEIYKKALKKFPEKSWKDRLARWFIKNERKQEFEEFSRQVLENFNEADTRRFLAEFIDGKVSEKPGSSNDRLYFALYSLARRRFPHNQNFVSGLLHYYKSHKNEAEYRKLLAEYYFESPEIRQKFLSDLAANGEIRKFLDTAEEKISSPNNLENLPYKLFRADAAVWISNYETAIDAYRELNRLYPNTPEFADKLTAYTRSFGQVERRFLLESAEIAHTQAEYFPSNNHYRTRAGEIRAESGDYEKAREEWRKLLATAKGEKEIYLETATVFWDYFQFPEALETIKKLRENKADETLLAFQAGAIYDALKDFPAALKEYVKALNSDTEADKYQTKKRLKILLERDNLAEQLENAFKTERAKQKDSSPLTFGYCEFLQEIGRRAEAESLLKAEVSRSDDLEFLNEARIFFSYSNNSEAERFVIARLAKSYGKSRKAFSYQFQLAENYSDGGENKKAADILSNLIAENPFNFGILKESADFYWRIGMRSESLKLLQNAMTRGRGEYRYYFARRLSSRLISLNRLSQAEKILLSLNAEDKEDGGVIGELTNIYVRTNQPRKLRQIADEKIKSIINQNLMPRDLKFEIIETRNRLANAFTRLKDYNSAVEQKIEIINLDPESEENVEDAISYVKRFGGDKLLEYYQKTAQASYKNYRWNVILAKIYEAAGDFQNAAENYNIAIHNQPEMIELYDALAANYEKSGNLNSALETINQILELNGEDKTFLQRKIEILKKLGKNAEAENELKKLPEEHQPKPKTTAEQLQEAENLQNTEKAKAIELYRNAFEKIYENPLEADLNAANISGYAQTLRQEENLDEIYKKLWNLREKLAAEADKKNSTKTGKARELLNILNGAMPEAVCRLVKTTATGSETSAIFQDIKARLEKTAADPYQTNSLLHDFISKCGFSVMEEAILIIRKDESFSSGNADNYHFRLRSLIDFYSKKGNFQRILEILETERNRDFDKKNFDYERRIAETARLLGNREKELFALRDFYNAVTKPSNQTDVFVSRYLEMLYQNNPEELRNLAQSPNANIFQLINFLISKKEKELAHLAIENASFPEIWKLTQNAETSLVLNEFDERSGNYFTAALQIAPIGKLIFQKPDKENAAVGNDWFDLAEKYGRLLYLAPTAADKNPAAGFLSANTENRPKDAEQQAKLGKFYLDQKDFRRALEHFQLASELNPNDKTIWTNLGVCYFQFGKIEKADKIWGKIIEDENAAIADAGLYLKTLSEYGQAEKARENLKPFLTEKLNSVSKNDENLKNLLHNLSKSFRDEQKQSAFFLELAKTTKENTFLPEFVIEKNLVSRKFFSEFYKLLIERSEGIPSYDEDFDFTSLLNENFETVETELLLDQQKNYLVKQPESDRLFWQREYLDFLFAENQNAQAGRFIAEIGDSMKKRFARPDWLRLANIRMLLRKNSARSLSELEKFVGIEVSPNVLQVKPPSIERLNEAVNLLQSENRSVEISRLKEEFYARMLALEQLSAANFVGLAEILLSRGENEAGLKLLSLMDDISGAEREETARAELAGLPLIKKLALKDVRLFETETVNDLNPMDVLTFSAAISARCGYFAEAEFYRRKLSAIAPENEENRLELARILAVNKKTDEASKLLSEIVAGRNETRKARWQALLIVFEIFGNNFDFWEKLKTDLQNLQNSDLEMWTALQAFSLYKSGRVVEAISLLENLEYKSPQVKFLKAVFGKNLNQDEFSLQKFLDLTENDSEINESFAAFEEKPTWQAIRFFLKNGKPLAALKLAEIENDLRIENAPEFQEFSYQTLSERAEKRERQSRFELLEILSKAAEETGETARAAEFEKIRLKLVSDKKLKLEIELRIEELKGKMPL